MTVTPQRPATVRDYPLIGSRHELSAVLSRAADAGHFVSVTTPIRQRDGRYTLTVRLRDVAPATTHALPAPATPDHKHLRLRLPRIGATTWSFIAIAITAVAGIAFIVFGRLFGHHDVHNFGHRLIVGCQ